MAPVFSSLTREAAIEQARREQRAIVTEYAEGWDRGSILGLSDWLFEEILLSGSDTDTSR